MRAVTRREEGEEEEMASIGGMALADRETQTHTHTHTQKNESVRLDTGGGGHSCL